MNFAFGSSRCAWPWRHLPISDGATPPPWTEGSYHKIIDEWGIEWWMPVEGGFYFDMRRHPLEHIDTIDGLKKIKFPDPLHPARFEAMAARADELMNQRQVAYVLGRNAPGIWEIALWMRGFENFFCDMAERPDFAEALMDIICEIKMKYWTRALEVLGPNVMMISEADDLASQDRFTVDRLVRAVVETDAQYIRA